MEIINTSSEVSFIARDRDENTTQWLLKLPSVQGAFDLEINGYFSHVEYGPLSSHWDLMAFGKCNGIEMQADELLKLLGNNCLDRGNELLENILTGYMRDDWDSWKESLDRARDEDDRQRAMEHRQFIRMSGF